MAGAGAGIVLGIALLADFGGAALRAGHDVIRSPAGSDPLTATCILLLSLAALATSNSNRAARIAAQAGIALALLLILARLGTSHFAHTAIARLLPLPRPAPRPPPIRWPSAFGVVSVASLFLLAAGELLLQYRQAKIGQMLAAGAGAGFLLTLLGYGAMLPPFDRPIALFLGLAGAATVLSVMAASGETAVVLRGLGARAVLAARNFDVAGRGRRTAEQHLRRDATTDRLTGLLSRNKMTELIDEQRRAPAETAIIMIDIDRFRSVNNALGTDAGDSLLVQAAKRLVNLAEPHLVARAGGDDFAIFCNGIGSAAASRLAQAVVEIMAVPFHMANGRQFHITASVGVAHGAIDGLRELRHAADEAMHIAKAQGGNQSVPFVSAMHEARIERAGLEQDLHRAFKSSSELFLVYQPIISLRDRRIVAVEALARWQHPQGAVISPARFVSIAESSGMFLGLGCKLRELAVVQAARWRDMALGGVPVINLNVSPLELARSDVPGVLGALIDRHGLERSGFCLEVTEGSFADERALQSLQSARNAGFKIAMDDFGVGYSSLTQLPRLPLTSVKLDRSFLSQATESEDGISLLATMVQLAHVLKLPVVAEGVESRQELNIVSDCGCDSVQGYLFSQPLTAEQLEPWLKPDHKAPVPAKAH